MCTGTGVRTTFGECNGWGDARSIIRQPMHRSAYQYGRARRQRFHCACHILRRYQINDEVFPYACRPRYHTAQILSYVDFSFKNRPYAINQGNAYAVYNNNSWSGQTYLWFSLVKVEHIVPANALFYTSWNFAAGENSGEFATKDGS